MLMIVLCRCSAGGKDAAAVGAISRNKLLISSWLFNVPGGGGQNPNNSSVSDKEQPESTHLLMPLSSPSTSFHASFGSLSASDAKLLRMLFSALTLDDDASPASSDSCLRASSIVGCMTSRTMVRPRRATGASGSSLLTCGLAPLGVETDFVVVWPANGGRDGVLLAPRRERELSRDDELV